MKIARCTCILIFCFISSFALSQNNRRFRHLNIDNGLAHTDALCLEQDHKGFIWIGTNSGLQRFDGRQLKTYLNQTSVLHAVYNNRITALKIQNDLLWIGSEGGLNCFNLRTDKFLSLKFSGNNVGDEFKTISNIEITGDDIWITSGNKINRCVFDSNKSTINFQYPADIIERLPKDLLWADFFSLESNGKDIIWAGTNIGLAVFIKKDNIISFLDLLNNRSEEVSLASNSVEDLLFAGNELWLRTGPVIQILSLDNISYKVRNSLKTFSLRELSGDQNLTDALFSRFIIDREDNLWVASNNGLIYLKNPKSESPSLQILRENQYDLYSLGGNNLSGLLIDRSNNLWISSWGGGVSYLDLEQKKFNLLTENPDKPLSSLKGSLVRSIAEDRDGFIWIGLRKSGINIFNPKNGRCFQLSDLYPGKFQLLSKDIRAIRIQQNKVYVGTNNGINILNLENKSTYPIIPGPGENDLSPSIVFSIEIDKQGQIWSGTFGSGINRIRVCGSKTEVLKITENSSPYSLSSDIVTFLFYDEKKNELLASTSKGLNRIILDANGNISDIIYYRANETSHSLSSEYLWPIAKQNDSVYWIGTLGGGLNRITITDTWDNKKIGKYTATSYTVKDGASGNDVESILTDDNGNLWIGGKGISRFNISLKEFWNFDVNDGLQSNGFKIGAAYKCKDGTLYFGGINGLNYFKPDEIKANSIKPVIAITSLKIHNQEIPTEDEIHGRVLLKEGIQYSNSIELKYIENDLSISFASLHFANPEKCKFKYILEGYDINWNYINGDYPVASYSNLDYGNYTFKLDATNSDDLWNGDPVTLNIKVTPPWWRTTLAYSAYVVLFLVAACGLYYNISRWIKMRNNLKMVEAEEKRKEELHQMKLQFFTNISHEFNTPLTLILSPVEKLLTEKNSESEQKKLLTLILNNANRLLHLVNELMDFRKAEMGKLPLQTQKLDFSSFSYDVYQQFVPLSKQKNITLNFVRKSESVIWFDAEMMAKILFNLFSNALKYTNDTGIVNVEVFEGEMKSLQPYFTDKYEIVSDNSIQEYCFIKVRDSGIGISEGSICHIFDRYYQVNKPSDRHLGTGVGLALLKSLVILHHGYIVVSSEQCSGTEIIVGFPLGDQHLTPEEKIRETVEKPGIYSEVFSSNELDYETEDDTPAIACPDDDYSSLLIVDDNPELRKLLADHYRTKYKVFEAEEGRIGFEIAIKEIPSLIISDVMMPVMNGFEMITLLKENIHTCHIPVVFLTAKSSIESQIEGIELGAVEYVSKPFNIRLLDAKINRFMENLNKLKEKYASDVFGHTRDIARHQKDQKFLEDLLEIIDQNIENSEFSVNDIGMKLSISRTNLYKKIKSLTDQSLGEFIRTYRLKKAAKILLTEDITVSEVIYRVGMNSHSYFTKSFKFQFNLTPSEFVKRNISHR